MDKEIVRSRWHRQTDAHLNTIPVETTVAGPEAEGI